METQQQALPALPPAVSAALANAGTPFAGALPPVQVSKEGFESFPLELSGCNPAALPGEPQTLAACVRPLVVLRSRCDAAQYHPLTGTGINASSTVYCKAAMLFPST